MSAGMKAPGLDSLSKQLRDAGDDLADLAAVNQDVADWLLARTRPRMPHRTGALVASMRAVGTATEAAITVGVPYARPALFGAPRAGQRGARVNPVDVIEATRAEWLQMYTEHATEVCATVKG